MAMSDPITHELLRRISWGMHDCYICRRTLDLKSLDGDSTPGIVGYMHGDLPKEIDGIGMAACSACAKKLGDKRTSKTITQMFADECCGGGKVEMVQGGTA
jgi:hypothetical protein